MSPDDNGKEKGNPPSEKRPTTAKPPVQAKTKPRKPSKRKVKKAQVATIPIDSIQLGGKFVYQKKTWQKTTIIEDQVYALELVEREGGQFVEPDSRLILDRSAQVIAIGGER